MSTLAYTLAKYRVKDGQEEEFVRRWNELAATFSSLPDPPLWGTLIRHASDRTLYYSFGPWRSGADVRAMRDSPAAAGAFRGLAAVCEEITPGDFEVVRHVDVAPHHP
jgi:heme-degrading monooxygenase HmoA